MRNEFRSAPGPSAWLLHSSQGPLLQLIFKLAQLALGIEMHLAIPQSEILGANWGYMFGPHTCTTRTCTFGLLYIIVPNTTRYIVMGTYFLLEM